MIFAISEMIFHTNLSCFSHRQGLAFFHEHGLTRIPFSASNIVMDIGLAPYPSSSPLPSPASGPGSEGTASATIPPWSLDRVAYPVKYNLASLDGLQFVRNREEEHDYDADHDEDPIAASSPCETSEEEYVQDVVRLGALVKELFASVSI